MIPFGYETISFPVGNLTFRAMFNWPNSFRLREDGHTMVMAPYHLHSQHELHYLRKGECSVQVSSQQITLKPGQYVLLGKNIPHGFISATKDWERITIQFSFASENTSSAIQDDLAGAFLNIAHFHYKGCAEGIESTLEKIIQELTEQKYGYYACVQSLFSYLMIQMCRHIIDLSPTDPRNHQSDNLDLLRLTILDEYFIKRIGVQASCTELAAMLGVSVRQLNRIIQQEYGCSFRKKLISARITASLPMLINTDESIDSIAQRVGYSCASSYVTAFREILGTTPFLYRKTHFKK